MTPSNSTSARFAASSAFSVKRLAGGDHLGIVMAEAVVGKRFDLMRQMDRLHAVGATALDTLVREAFTEVPVQIPANFAFHNSYLPSFYTDFYSYCFLKYLFFPNTSLFFQ